MAADLTFSVASPSDAERIQTLLHAAFRADDSRPDWTADPEMNRRFTVDLDDLVAKLGDPDTVYLIAPSSSPGSDELTACIGITKLTLTRGRPSPVTAARLSNLAIDPKLHRGGLGRRVLEYAERYSREDLGAQVLSLDALSTRIQLIEWYQRRGFRKTGEVVPFPVKLKDGLVLPDDLGFVQFEKELDV